MATHLQKAVVSYNEKQCVFRSPCLFIYLFIYLFSGSSPQPSRDTAINKCVWKNCHFSFKYRKRRGGTGAAHKNNRSYKTNLYKKY